MMKPQQYSAWFSDKKPSYGSLPSSPEDFTPPSKYDGWKSNVVTSTLQENEPLVIWERSEPWLKRRIWRNVLLVGLAFFFFFIGMSPMTTVQSSLNSEDGLGVVSLAVKNACMLLGSLVATSVLIKFGCKVTLVVSMFIFCSYVMANFYPAWYTLIPAACLSGAASTFMWTAQKVYLAKLAQLYSSITDIDEDRIQSRLFVLMAIFFKLSGSVGNLVSSVILGTQGYSEYMSASRLMLCGAKYCNEELDAGFSGMDNSTSGFRTPANVSMIGLYAPGKWQVYGLCTFCLGSCLVGVVFLLFIDPLSKLGLTQARYKKPFGQSLLEVFQEMKDVKHIMLIPMALIMGGSDSFWAADFNKAFITCAIGIQFIGYVSIWNGLSGAFSSLLFGWFNKKKVRCFPFAFATLIQMAILTLMFYWSPNSGNYLQMSLFAVAWFFGSGIRLFIVPAFYAVLFSNNLEVAFSIYHIWTFGASTLVYAWSNLLCMTTKIYILLALLAASFLGYLGVEIALISRKKKYARINNQVEIVS